MEAISIGLIKSALFSIFCCAHCYCRHFHWCTRISGWPSTVVSTFLTPSSSVLLLLSTLVPHTPVLQHRRLTEIPPWQVKATTVLSTDISDNLRNLFRYIFDLPSSSCISFKEEASKLKSSELLSSHHCQDFRLVTTVSVIQLLAQI